MSHLFTASLTGEGVVRQLSVDLKERYPKMGLSPRQLWNMKKFYLRYAGHDEKLLRTVALLPWSHNLLIMSKNKNDSATLYYAQETIAKGWNPDLLLNAIKLNMYESQRATKVDNNFSRTLHSYFALIWQSYECVSGGGRQYYSELHQKY